MDKLYINTLAPKTKKLLEKIQNIPWLKDFYLAGGTAFALQYGHRQSVDLDWFTNKNFSTKILLKKLSDVGKFELLNEEEWTLEGYLEGVKVSFMKYPYPLLEKTIKFNGGVMLAAPLDIALMKVTAISGRNVRKDFIDLYFYLQKENIKLDFLFSKMKQKFIGINYDPVHICKSLVYFKEADEQPMPKMLVPVLWVKVKNFFKKEVSGIF